MNDHQTGNVRKIAGVSRQELERRWKLVRDHLKTRGIDCLIAVTTDSANSAGYTRWLTDATSAYRHVVVFHAVGPMTVVVHGHHGTSRTLKDEDPQNPGVGEILDVAVHQGEHRVELEFLLFEVVIGAADV